MSPVLVATKDGVVIIKHHLGFLDLIDYDNIIVQLLSNVVLVTRVAGLEVEKSHVGIPFP
jgi:hypothetical protein